MSINDLFKIHKKVMFSKHGTAVKTVLKPYPSHSGFEVEALTNFVGLTIDESGYGCFADSFDLTINFDDLREQTTLIPVRGWFLDVELPQLNNKVVSFYIEAVATDRTLGMYLIKCSSSTSEGKGKQNIRNNGGI